MTASLFRESIPNYEHIPLQAYLERAAAQWPDKVAVIDGDRSVTYAEMLSQAQSFAIGLTEMGVQKGDHVALLAPNCAEYASVFFGVQFHPEVNDDVLHRWLDRDPPPEDLAFRGAQPAEEQYTNHARYQAAMHNWLRRFLSFWVATGEES